MAEYELAELVSRYRKRAGLTQEGVAARLSDVLGRRVQQSQVSDNEKGSRWSDPDLPGAYVRALDIPPDEMMAATGYPKPARGGPKAVTIADLVKNDPSLTTAAKKHLLQQYELLQLASRAERAGKGPLSTDSKRSGRSAAQ